MSRKISGSQIIIETLLEQGVEEIFGYPGGCVIPLFDELLNYPKAKLILVRHEQGASHAAEGLAKVTGKAGVAIVTSGPGATNCVTGIADAMLDSVPMVVISGQVRRQVLGTDAFQETNVIGVTRPITKHNFLVNDIIDLKAILEKAFYIAENGRPGPVLIDIPVDIQRELIESSKLKKFFPKKCRGFQLPAKPPMKTLHKIWELLQAAEKPLIYAGGGLIISGADKELFDFVGKTNIPIATTILGQGVFPQANKLCLGMLGMHGNYTANTAMTKTDLVLAIGVRFDDRVTGKVDDFLMQSKIIHIDIDHSSLDKIKKADIKLHCDAKVFLQNIIPIVSKLETKKWRKELELMKKKFPPPNYDNVDSAPKKIRPEFIVKQLSDITKGNAYIVTDVGQHQMFTCLHYKYLYPRTQITSGGLGTMGFCLPAAMGIAIRKKDRPTISISGDGGFQMNMQELATIRSYSIPVKIIIFNNNNLGMVKQWQDFFWDNRYASTIFDQNPDFILLAKSFDIPAIRVSKKEEVADSIHKMLKTQGPILVEYKIDPDAHVYPMIPSGARLQDIIIDENHKEKKI
jgi:acetolactate synthase-1/2/3 large subunit